MVWIRSTGCVSKREEKVFSLHSLFILIPLHKPCEKSLLYPIVKKLLTGQLLSDLCGCELSPGTLEAFIAEGAARLAHSEEQIKQALRAAEVRGTDETGIRV